MNPRFFVFNAIFLYSCVESKYSGEEAAEIGKVSGLLWVSLVSEILDSVRIPLVSIACLSQAPKARPITKSSWQSGRRLRRRRGRGGGG